MANAGVLQSRDKRPAAFHDSAGTSKRQAFNSHHEDESTVVVKEEEAQQSANHNNKVDETGNQSNQTSSVKETVISRVLSGLNSAQKEAVTAPVENPLQVIAGPGTGKTKVITARVAYLILKHNIQPSEIIVTTFTTNAAKEMIERLSELLQPGAIVEEEDHNNTNLNGLIIGTFHSICCRILRKYGFLLGLSAFSIADTAESNTVLKDILGRKDISEQLKPKKQFQQQRMSTNDQLKSYKTRISSLKSKGLLPSDYHDGSTRLEPKLYTVYQAYQQQLQKLNLLDFDDLLLYTHKLLGKFPFILNYLKHIFVDEFQDTNKIQLDLLYQFAKNTSNNNVTVVGDPDQSIYGFRNAVVQNFEFMATAFARQLKVVYLNENYRSTSHLLAFSEAVMSQDLKRQHQKSLKSQFKTSFPPVYKKFSTDTKEARFIGNDILYLLSLPNQIFKRSDIAILVRAAYQSRKIEQALIERKITYKINKGVSFWQRKEVALVLDYLTVLASNNAKMATLRTLGFQAKGLGAKSLKNIEEILTETTQPALLVVAEIASGKYKMKISGNAKKSIQGYCDMITSARKILEGNDAAADLHDVESLADGQIEENEQLPIEKQYLLNGLDYIYQNSGLEEMYKENQEAILNHLELKGELKQFIPVAEAAIPDFSNAKETAEYPRLPVDDIDHSINGDVKVKKQEREHEVDVATVLFAKEPELGVYNLLRLFLDSVHLYASNSHINDDAEDQDDVSGAITISTIHAAKGLEWPIVYIPGLNEGILPSRFALTGNNSTNIRKSNNKNFNGSADGDKDEVEVDHDPISEERRIFYVAATRAKTLLILSSYTSQGGDDVNGNGLYSYQSVSSMRYSPSRYLNLSITKGTIAHQNALNSVEQLKKLYEIRSGQWPEGGDEELGKLTSDYRKFSRSDNMVFYWNNRVYPDFKRVPAKMIISVAGAGEITDVDKI